MKTKEEKEAKKKYDNISEFYHDYRTKVNPKGWFFNEMLEMPATLELLGNVKDKDILDFGCGTGIYAKLLEKKGAKISGFDISKKMLNVAKKDNPKLDLRQGSGYKIPFDRKFDVVFASLVLDYLDNWDRVFQEVSRVLKRDGFFIFSIGNPVSETVKTIVVKGKKLKVLGAQSYFDEKVIYSDWTFANGRKLKMPSHHKTYETIVKTIIKNGFEIVDYKDSYPIKKAKKLFPEYYNMYIKSPYFCVWKVKKK